MLSEEQFQAECTQWFHNTYPLLRGMLFAVDNNVSHRLDARTRAIEGNRKKAVGIIPGVSDLVMIGNGAVYFIELKLDKGFQSPEQKEFQRKVEERGHFYCVIRPPVSNFKELIYALSI